MASRLNMDTRRRLESNIWKYSLMKFLALFLLCGSIATLYLLDFGYSMFQIAVYGSIGSALIFILELPSGLFADLYGRKNSLLIYGWAYLLWIVCLYFGGNYFLLLLSGIFSGIRLAFRSGADSALLYDSLKALGREDEHPKISGSSNSWFLFGIGVSSMLGGFLADQYSMGFTILASLIAPLISLIVIYSMEEPAHYRSVKKKSLKDHIQEIYRLIHTNKKLVWLTIFFALMQSSILFTWLYTQVFLGLYKVSFSMIGTYFFVFLLFAMLSSHFYGTLHKLLNDVTLFRLSAIIFCMALFLMSVPSLALFVLMTICIELVYGASKPLSNHIINCEVGSEYRATMLSAL